MKGIVHQGTHSTRKISQAVKNKGYIKQNHFVRYVTFFPTWSIRLLYLPIYSSKKLGT